MNAKFEGSIPSFPAYIYSCSPIGRGSCVDCGEADPIVLEFDHIQQKKYGISRMVYAGMGVDSISKEIEKCEVRCANCHRRATAKRSGWSIRTFESDALGY
ncbi:HNH endonuclease [Nostoc linckia FACHB-391]|uniref:HNH endonuclease n=2 Tax=Nostoc TaxID=1177 RepID=A0ABR8IEU9_9NOSO|nr:HNH endonuclease [Nostoc linckia FACHB-391]MBD2650086.1 HNH endonuclease [Nostoc foliaceum FACHB-393]